MSDPVEAPPEQDWRKIAEDRINALEQELKREKDQRINAQREGSLRSAVSKVAWFDPDDAVRELLPLVREQDGRTGVMGKRTIDGKEFDELYTFDDAVKQLAQRKAHWVKADVRGGSGASGVSSIPSTAVHADTMDWESLSFKRLKSDPLLMLRAVNEKGQAWVSAKQNRYFEKRGHTIGGTTIDAAKVTQYGG